jgi:hypothetical protein
MGRRHDGDRVATVPGSDIMTLAEQQDATFVTADRRLVKRAAKRRLRVPVADLAAF